MKESKLGKCPFYRAEGTTEILCEGLFKGSLTKTVFKNSAFKGKVTAEWCHTMDYHSCPVYKALSAKYE